MPIMASLVGTSEGTLDPFGLFSNRFEPGTVGILQRLTTNEVYDTVGTNVVPYAKPAFAASRAVGVRLPLYGNPAVHAPPFQHPGLRTPSYGEPALELPVYGPPEIR